MRKTALLWMTLFYAALIYSQDETSNWYFGEQGGIRFNQDGSVTALEDGQIFTFEGCATISDSAGNLLFYTDGITVYDREHEVMEGGRGLYGDSSSTQSGLIVPDPGDPNLFYIFTVDTKVFPEDPDFGLNYSVVDITMNAGRGAVIRKNINLLPDCSEKITAVIKDCADRSIWVLTLATSDGSPGLLDTFHAYEVGTAGVVTTSVKSTFSDLAIPDPRGYIKISPDGTKVANANASAGLYLYDFDSNTGVLTNQTFIEINGVNRAAYGLEFSPSSELLYVHASNDLQGETGHSSTLYQYDLTAADISASEIVIDQRNEYRAALQLGSNGKIYRTIAESYNVGTSYLGVINNPNVRGTGADYQHQAVSLGTGVATQGLPPFVQSFFNKIAIIRNPDGSTSNSLELCEGESFFLETEVFPGATYEWLKDGQSLANTTNSFPVNNTTVADSGRYTVTITTPDPKECPIIGEALITVNPVPQATDEILIQCDIDEGASEDGIALFNLAEIINDTQLEYDFYATQADLNSDNPIVNFDNYRNSTPFNEVIYYRVINEFGCEDLGELELEIRSNPFASQSLYTLYSCDTDPTDGAIMGDFELRNFALDQYPNVTVSYYRTTEEASLKNNPLPDIFTSNNRTIFARLDLDNECLGVDKIDLEVLPTPIVELQPSYLLCTDGADLNIIGPPGYDFYRWERINGGSLLSDSNSVTISELGSYRLVAGYNYDLPGGMVSCEQSADFEVLPSNRAVIQDIAIDDFNVINTVDMNVSGDGFYEYSLDGFSYQSSSTFEDVQPGFYTVSIRDRNGCGITEQDISVLGYPKFFTPNGDGINDFWKITGTSEQFQADAFITIYDRYGKLLSQISPLDEGWNGMFQSNPMPASDYWFRVKLSDGREVTGHFALKR